MTSLSRRHFLTAAGGLIAGRFLGSCSSGRGDAGLVPARVPTPPAAAVPAPTAPATAPPPPSGGRRVLVVVQLGGGNDALNTLVPVDGRYHDARPRLGLPDDGLLRVPGTDAYGLHPALAPLGPLLAAGQVAVIAGVGFPDPDRSHFAALDTWWTATPGQASSTGWLGRALDASASPDGAPLRAVALGGGTPALAADHVRPAVVQTPDGFVLQTPPGADRDRLLAAWRRAATAPPGAGAAAEGLAAEAGAATLDALSAVEVFAALGDVAHAEAGESPEQGDAGQEITRALATAAELVVADQGTEVIYVSAGGFDTHAAQATTHERLLADLAGGIAAFSTTLAARGHADRVVLMTVSEFGRRVAENGSGGTDHGKAGVQFMVGPAVRGGVVGGLDLAHLDDGDRSPGIDARSLHADALAWLGVPADAALPGGTVPVGVVAP